jgi:hypothetical protein
VGGEGEGVMEFMVLNAATEQMIYRYQHWYAVPSPDLPIHFLQRIQRCVFPQAGRYLVSLRFEGDILLQRHLDVHQD